MIDEGGRDDDSIDPSDWLSAQFGSDDDLPEDPHVVEPPQASEAREEPELPRIEPYFIEERKLPRREPYFTEEPNAADLTHVAGLPNSSDQHNSSELHSAIDRPEQPRYDPLPWAPVAASESAADAIPVVPTFAPPPPISAPPISSAWIGSAPDQPLPLPLPQPLTEPQPETPTQALTQPLTQPLAAPFLPPLARTTVDAEPPVAPPFFAQAAGGVFNWGLTPTVDATSASNQDASNRDASNQDVPNQDAPNFEALAFPGAGAQPDLADAASSDVPPDASRAGAQSPESGAPTVAFAWEGTATELFAPAAPSPSVAEPATELLGRIARRPIFEESGSRTDAVDALFGAMGVPENTGRFPAPAAVPERTTRDRPPRSQLVLIWVAVALVALLALAVLFFVGTRVSQLTGAAPVMAVTPSVSVKLSPTPSATPTVLPVGPVTAGTYKWDGLRGGECLAPYDSAWAEKFTVVDCATAHPAQMVFRGTFPGAEVANAPYPGVAALQAQINLLCTAPSVINLGAAGAYNDIQIAGSFPATEKQWTSGSRSYYCFVSRSSGQPLTTSVAAAPAA